MQLSAPVACDGTRPTWAGPTQGKPHSPRMAVGNFVIPFSILWHLQICCTALSAFACVGVGGRHAAQPLHSTPGFGLATASCRLSLALAPVAVDESKHGFQADRQNQGGTTKQTPSTAGSIGGCPRGGSNDYCWCWWLIQKSSEKRQTHADADTGAGADRTETPGRGNPKQPLPSTVICSGRTLRPLIARKRPKSERHL